jgi:hypothetical protein
MTQSERVLFMRFNESEFAEYYNSHQVRLGYPGRLLHFILGELKGLHTVIDIGSGTGLISIPLVSAGHKVTAVEPSMEMINVMIRNTPAEYKYSLEFFNTTWENWEGYFHEAAIMVHSVYSMKDIKKSMELMISFAAKRILIVRDSYHMKTLSGIMREKLGMTMNRDINNEICGILNSLSCNWKKENIYEERRYPLADMQSETDSIMYQLKLDDSFREKVEVFLAELICSSGSELFFNAVFSDNAYIF